MEGRHGHLVAKTPPWRRAGRRMGPRGRRLGLAFMIAVTTACQAQTRVGRVPPSRDGAGDLMAGDAPAEMGRAEPSADGAPGITRADGFLPGSEPAQPDGGVWSSRPAGIDEQTPVRSLGALERRRWCGWYDALWMENPPAPAAPYPSCREPVPVCLPGRPVLSSCVQVLEASGCSAAVQALTDCVLTLFGGCNVTGGGCSPLRDGQGCQDFPLIRFRLEECGL